MDRVGKWLSCIVQSAGEHVEDDGCAAYVDHTVDGEGGVDGGSVETVEADASAAGTGNAPGEALVAGVGHGEGPELSHGYVFNENRLTC